MGVGVVPLSSPPETGQPVVGAVIETCPVPVGANVSPPVIVRVTPESLPVSAILIVAPVLVEDSPAVRRLTLSTRTPPEVLVEDAGV